jgi:hypothetical protein
VSTPYKLDQSFSVLERQEVNVAKLHITITSFTTPFAIDSEVVFNLLTFSQTIGNELF